MYLCLDCIILTQDDLCVTVCICVHSLCVVYVGVHMDMRVCSSVQACVKVRG